jgi:hypothetical protein
MEFLLIIGPEERKGRRTYATPRTVSSPDVTFFSSLHLSSPLWPIDPSPPVMRECHHPPCRVFPTELLVQRNSPHPEFLLATHLRLIGVRPRTELRWGSRWSQCLSPWAKQMAPATDGESNEEKRTKGSSYCGFHFWSNVLSFSVERLLEEREMLPRVCVFLFCVV